MLGVEASLCSRSEVARPAPQVSQRLSYAGNVSLKLASWGLKGMWPQVGARFTLSPLHLVFLVSSLLSLAFPPLPFSQPLHRKWPYIESNGWSVHVRSVLSARTGIPSTGSH